MKRIIPFLVGVFVTLSIPGHAQKNSKLDSIPFNPSVRHGILSNGLKYFILKSDRPEDKIRMQLVVKAGRIDQDSDQVEIAHLVEHLGMRSTRNFPKGLKQYFFDKGLGFGKDFNASTGWITNYWLVIPATDSSLVQKGLFALRDWAGGISFLPEEIEEERSAVLRESLEALSPVVNGMDELRYRQFDGNPFYKVDRRADMESLKTASIETLLRFYNDWYHPLNQAIIIVGPVDESIIEQKVKTVFSDLTNVGARKREERAKLYDVPLTGENKVLIADFGYDFPQTTIQVFKKQKSTVTSKRPTTISEYRISLIDQLINTMMSQRQQSLKKDDSDTRIYTAIERRAIFPAAGIDALTAMTFVDEHKKVKPAILEIFMELKRLELFGFTEEEFTRAKGLLKAKIFETDTNISSTDLSARIIGHYTDGWAYPAYELQLKNTLLAEINLKQINTVLRDWLETNENTDVIIITDSNSQKYLSEAEVFSWILQSHKNRVSPYIEHHFKIKALPPIPLGNYAQQSVVTELTALDATKIVLPNGVTVFLKCTDAQGSHTNQVMLIGLNRNVDLGLKQSPTIAQFLENISLFTGICSLSASDLKTFKTEHNIAGLSSLSVYPYMRFDEVGVKGSASLDNIKTLMQLTYLYMTQGRMDTRSFNDYSISSASMKKKRSGIQLLTDTIQSVIGGYLTVDANDQIKLRNLSKIYKAEFSKTSDFTFVIAGAFEKEQMISLVTRYLGVLPSQQLTTVKPEKTINPINSQHFDANKVITLIGDSVGNAQVRVLFMGRSDLKVRDKLILDVTASVIQSLLFQRLREQEKGVYSVLPNWRIGTNRNEIYLEIAFETDPIDVDRLVTAVKDEIELLASGQLSDKVYSNSLETIRSRIAGQLKTPFFWVDYLTEQIRIGEMSADALNQSEILKQLTASDITNFIRNNLNTSDIMLFKLL